MIDQCIGHGRQTRGCVGRPVEYHDRRDEDEMPIGNLHVVSGVLRGVVAQRYRVERARENEPRKRIDCVEHVHSVADHLAEYRKAAVLDVQVGTVVTEIDEPLVGGAVGVAGELRHRDSSPDVGELRLVDDRSVLNDADERFTSFVGKSTTLRDESADHAVDNGIVVGAGIDVGQKFATVAGVLWS